MPKVVENYVLERKIGSGQYGDVFKGFNRTNSQDIAIKVINREKLKGKFNELFDNEIRVLKACNNINIVKLYDIKKTANNYYLIMEYCNEGDLAGYLKARRRLSEDEAVEFLVQILNAFRSLVKNKIMHRDFKLANILKHDGHLKIADFGFSKLLEEDDVTTATMLGSPLNMAPEILNNKEYNNKADIWSIGTVFYEILFGKPPYTASNIVELVKKVNTKALTIPKREYPISDLAEDLLRRMLVQNPAHRIEWEDLFSHRLLRVAEEKIKAQLTDTLKGEDVEFNISRFYMKNNLVVDHPADITKKEEMNNFAHEVIQGRGDRKYEGEILKRREVEKEEAKDELVRQEEYKDDGGYLDKETKREVFIKIMKRNTTKLLNYRNFYVFLARMADECMEHKLKTSELASYCLVRRLISLLEWLKKGFSRRDNIADLPEWEAYVKTNDFREIEKYIMKEYDIFKVFYNRMLEKVRNSPFAKDNLEFLAYEPRPFDFQDAFLLKGVVDYCKELIAKVVARMKQDKEQDREEFKPEWVHMNRFLDTLDPAAVFKLVEGVNFRQYYDDTDKPDVDEVLKQVQHKFKSAKEQAR
jgi:serine/threonine-protein kinase ULK/ATG1